MKFVRMGVITAVLAVLAALSAVSLNGRRADSAGEQVEQRLGLLNEMVTADPRRDARLDLVLRGHPGAGGRQQQT
ncbi:MAG: hypothetical protein IPH81_18025 [Candidatus Microthrix sp.]|nr:hypothetical protein [Candidatus Microthrix sp.]